MIPMVFLLILQKRFWKKRVSRLIPKALIRLWTSRERLLVNQEKYQTTWEQIQLFMKTSTQLLQVNSLVMTR